MRYISLIGLWVVIVIVALTISSIIIGPYDRSSYKEVPCNFTRDDQGFWYCTHPVGQPDNSTRVLIMLK